MIKTVIYLRRIRDTHSPGKVLVTTFESHSNVAQVCLNYCRLNTLAEEEEDEEGVQINDSDEDNSSIPDTLDPYEKVYSNMPTNTHILKPVKDCKHCGAKKFESEPPGFFCRSGKIHLNAPDTLDELVRLWSSADADARHFRNNIRFFNGHFSFTSLYCHLDSATANMKNSGIYTFRAHGQIYHNIRSFGTEDGKEPRHLELYFYDDDPSLEHRYRK
jgi:hypothetical protein